MGIKYGVSAVFSKMSNGLYRLHDPKTVTIYVDGELIRYKGMIQDNLTCADAEEAIAYTSYQYLAALIKNIKSHLSRGGGRVDEIVVYMDGDRVINKTQRTQVAQYEIGVVRQTFCARCTSNGMRVVWLDEGESEIQMYLRRDRNNDLNVFISADSDLIPIMYGHEAISDEVAVTDADIEPCSSPINSKIKDCNRVYRKDVNVRDSCLWIRCGQTVEAFGMDDVRKLINLSTKSFRIMMGLCGSDFTCSAFTETMIQLILLSTNNGDDTSRLNVETLNNQTDTMRIVCSLIYLAVSHGCTLKRADDKQLQFVHSPATTCTFTHTENMLLVYLTYLETGKMIDDIEKPMPLYLLRLCLYAMIGRLMKLSRGDLLKWTKTVSMSEALANFDRNRNDPQIHDFTRASFIASAPSRGEKRKRSQFELLISAKRYNARECMPHLESRDAKALNSLFSVSGQDSSNGMWVSFLIQHYKCIFFCYRTHKIRAHEKKPSERSCGYLIHRGIRGDAVT